MKKYVKHPVNSRNPESDFEARKAIFGRGETMYIEEKKISEGVLVYLNYFKEGDDAVFTGKNKIERKCNGEITVCGYRKTRILFGKRIQLIPEEEQEEVKSKLLKQLFNQEIKSVDFW